MNSRNFTIRIEELTPFASWLNELLKKNQVEFEDYSTDFNNGYATVVDNKITAVSKLIATSLFIGELSNATNKLYANLEAARPFFLKLEGLVDRADGQLTVPVKKFDFSGLRKCLNGRDDKGFSKRLNTLLQLTDANKEVLQAKGMKPELVSSLSDILTNTQQYSKEQNEKMLAKEDAVSENVHQLNDLWADCQNIMDAGKRIYKYKQPEMVKNFTRSHILKTMRHDGGKGKDKGKQV